MCACVCECVRERESEREREGERGREREREGGREGERERERERVYSDHIHASGCTRTHKNVSYKLASTAGSISEPCI